MGWRTKKRGIRGQVSIEYMIILGFVVLALVPLTLVYFSYSTETKQQIIDSQVNQIERKIVDSAEAVYYLGELSRTTIKVYIPENIVSVNITGRTINFRIKSVAGISDTVVLASVNMTGSINPNSGIKLISIGIYGSCHIY
jgi:hypothetical protein